MASLNKIFLIGYLGRDPETRYTNGGQTVTNFSMATTETWKDQSGDRQERTEWHKIVVWGKAAEHCGEYLSKGRLVHVEGRIQTREWEGKDGEKKYTTEVVANRVTFLGGRDRPATDSGPGQARRVRKKTKQDDGEPSESDGYPDDQDDLPF